MGKSSGSEWGTLVCEAFGIDPNKVMRVYVSAEANEELVVELTLAPLPEVMGALRECAARLRNLTDVVEIRQEQESVEIELRHEKSDVTTFEGAID